MPTIAASGHIRSQKMCDEEFRLNGCRRKVTTQKSRRKPLAKLIVEYYIGGEGIGQRRRPSRTTVPYPKPVLHHMYSVMPNQLPSSSHGWAVYPSEPPGWLEQTEGQQRFRCRASWNCDS